MNRFIQLPSFTDEGNYVYVIPQRVIAVSAYHARDKHGTSLFIDNAREEDMLIVGGTPSSAVVAINDWFEREKVNRYEGNL